MKINILFLWIILSLPLYSATNLDVQDSLAKEFAHEVKTHLEKNNINVLKMKINDHEASWLIEQKVNNLLVKNEIKIKDKAMGRLFIIIKKIDPEYFFVKDDDDLLKRNIELSLEYKIEGKGGLLHSDEFVRTFTDTLRKENYLKYETPEHDFTQGNMPEEDLSFLEKYIEPVAIVGAAVLSVYLFFSIRSQ